MPSDDIRVTAGGMSISGWTDVRITRGIERLPSDFSVGLTENYPGELSTVTAVPGDPCTVWAGADLLVTGYVDVYAPSYDESQHSITMAGRSQCQDLVDCSAEWPQGQFSSSTLLSIARQLAQPYQIEVRASASAASLPVVVQINVMIGESAFDIIERLARFSAVLAYDLPDGSLYFAQAGTRTAASGFVEGQNVQSAGLVLRADERYSEYDMFLTNLDVLHDLGDAGNQVYSAKDPAVKRNRKLLMVAEPGAMAQGIVALEANWQKSRRAGRATTVRLRADSWRDSAGKLWEPNTLVTVDLPKLKIHQQQMCISEVTYIRNDDAGTVADLVLMPPEAFQPEPVVLNPIAADLVPP